MKNYLILILIFVSFITVSYSGMLGINLLGGTELNGAGCVCHTVERDTTVSVWIEGPDSLAAGQTGIYKMFLANGPAEAGGYNVAGRFGIMSLVDTLSYWHPNSPNELTQAFPLVFPTPQDTIYWEFAYTVPDSVVIDTLYSCGLSLVYDSIPDYHDRWNFGLKFPITVYQSIIPVELISFNASLIDNNILLSWITSTETNNQKFEIERRKVREGNSSEWTRIAVVNGNGTTTEIRTYSYIDEELSSGSYQYRLKQVDFNGSYKYLTIGQSGLNIAEVEVTNPSEFVLKQNYPNPFNPATNIQFEVNTKQFVTLKVYDVLGNEISVLLNEEKPAGNYTASFDAKNLTSGIYFYKLIAGNKEVTKKMILLR